MIKLKNKLNKMQNQKGFTLIELIVVIAIIAIIAAIAMQEITQYIAETNRAKAFTEIKTVAEAVQKRYLDTGLLLADGDLGTASANCTTLKTQVVGADGLPKGPWMKTCPISPWTGQSYTFIDTSTSDKPGDFDITISDGTNTYRFSELGRK